MNQDKAFDQYLKGNSALSQVYAELPDTALPAHLDAAILAEAHRAVNAGPGAKPKRRWTIPLGMVATLFVAVMAGLQLPHMLKDAASPQQQQEEKMAAMMDTTIAAQTSDAPETHKKTQEIARVQAQAKSESTRIEPVMEAVNSGSSVRMSAPVIEPPQKSVASESRFSNNTLVSPATPIEAPAPQPAKPMGFSASGYIAHDKALAKEKKASGFVQDKQNEALDQSAPAAAMMLAPQAEQLKHVPKEEASEPTSTSEDWLKRIKKLTTEGKLDEAKKELAAFKKRYPDYQVPEAFEIR